MTSTFSPSPNPPPPSALVIQPHIPDLRLVLAALSPSSFDVVVVEHYADAKAALKTMRPALLVTDVRLTGYNGLHLVLRAQAAWPGVPAIVTSRTNDAVLQQEAERLGATWVLLPTSETEMAAAILRTGAKGRGSAAVRPPFERRQAERRHSIALRTTPDERRQAQRRRAADASQSAWR